MSGRCTDPELSADIACASNQHGRLAPALLPLRVHAGLLLHPIDPLLSHCAPAVPDFLNGRQLRDYQLKSLQWMVANWHQEINCILGDEVREG